MSVLLIVFLVLRSVYPVAMFADVSPTPTSTPSVSPSNSPIPTPNTSPSPTPIPSPSPTDTPSVSPGTSPSTSPTPSVSPSPSTALAALSLSPSPSATPSPSTTTTINNGATVTNNTTSKSNTGVNTASTSGTVTTGKGTSVAQIDNSVNTTQQNSQIYYQTINIFSNQTGNLDLSVPAAIVADLIKNKDLTAGSINVSMISNDAYLINNISSTANTGQNNGGNVTTGDAYSIISLLNKVNMTVINSHVHIVTINIFGALNGNIMLPILSPNGSACPLCGTTQTLTNSATVVNNATSSANTGTNNASGSGATITTGNAVSYAGILNVVNASYINVDVAKLFINVFGGWSGNYLGFTNKNSVTSGSALTDSNLSALQGGNGCCVTSLSLTNSATVINNVNSSANTGNNTGKNITTGNAFSAISIFNFINTTFINSNAFFGFFNIFGKLTGNIGSKDLFPTPTPQAQSHNSSVSKNESGGIFGVSASNNVGQYVLPGDTVTLFVNVKNVGTGKIYNAKVLLDLVKDGIARGGGSFNLGDIDRGRLVKLTTGMVLTKKLGPGNYTVRAYTTGKTGDSDISGKAASSFLVYGYVPNQSFSSSNGNQDNGSKVLSVSKSTGNSHKVPSKPNYIPLLLLIVLLYFVVENVKKKNHLIVLKAIKENSKKITLFHF